VGERDKGAGSIFFLLLLSLLLISRFRSFCYNLAEQIFRNWHFVSFGRGGGGGGELKEEPRKRKKTVQSRKERSKVGKNTSSFASFFRFPTMAAVDVAFKLTCATLFATALASGAWLTASMVKGYNDAQEYQVRREERRELERSIRPRRREHKTSFFKPRHSFSPRPPTQKKNAAANTPAAPQRSRPTRRQDVLRLCLFYENKDL